MLWEHQEDRSTESFDNAGSEFIAHRLTGI